MNGLIPVLAYTGCGLVSFVLVLGVVSVAAGRSLDRRRREILEHGRIQDERERGSGA